jgi:hypothetical protein
MLLHRLIDAVAPYLSATLPVGTAVSTLLPRVVADIPAVVLSVDTAAPLGAGVGGLAKGINTGALLVQVSIALADPVLHFGSETVPLLSADRLSLQLPHCPLVDADGNDIGPLTPGAVTAQRGAVVYTLVNAVPGPTQFRVDRVTGIAVFGAPLPATGSLSLAYFIGQWEADTARFSATLSADVYASSPAALDALSRSVAAAMASQRVSGLSGVAPLTWGAMATPIAPKGNTLHRLLSWSCRFEYDDPRILTGGGPVRVVSISLTPRPGALPTTFTVQRP